MHDPFGTYLYCQSPYLPEPRHSPERTSIDLDAHEFAATLYDSPDGIPKPSFGAWHRMRWRSSETLHEMPWVYRVLLDRRLSFLRADPTPSMSRRLAAAAEGNCTEARLFVRTNSRPSRIWFKRKELCVKLAPAVIATGGTDMCCLT